MTRTRDQHLFDPGPKRILCLDGGGVRGLITLGMLKKVEDELKSRAPDPEKFRLCHYFDLIAGTSTGALISTLLALGETVDDITELYHEMCPQIFGQSRSFWGGAGIWSKFDARNFDKIVKRAFDKVLSDNNAVPHDAPMNTDLLRTGLALVTKRIDTGAVWVLSNNPRHKFWDANSPHWRDYWSARPDVKFFANGSYSLRKVAQASASAPFYLDAVQMDISQEEQGLFLDGGASPFNNPSAEIFLMTTLKADRDCGNGQGISPHGFGWPTGRDNIFMLSLGTGEWRERVDVKEHRSRPAALKALKALRGIISDAEVAATTFMQSISENPRAHYINFNLDDMRGLRIIDEPLLTFRRVNAVLDAKWLEKELGEEFKFSDTIVNKLRQLDLPEKANLRRCLEIGKAAGDKLIDATDFPEAFDI